MPDAVNPKQVVDPNETFAASIEVGDDSRDSLFQCVSSALHFPDYFGYNWDALQDCLSDLEWIESSKIALYWQGGLGWGQRNPSHFVQFLSVVADSLDVLQSQGKRLTLRID